MRDMDIYESYTRMFPGLAEITTEWKSIGMGEIRVTLEDGDEYIYDSMDQTLIPLRRNGFTDEERWLNEFGRRLKKKMYMRGITQTEVAERCGVTQATVSKYLSGRSMPSAYAIKQIAGLLNCSPDDLFNIAY